MTPRRYQFGLYDRLTMSGIHYKWMDKKEGIHFLQRVIGNVLEPGVINVTDDQISEHMRRKDFRLEQGYYSKAHAELRIRNGDSQLLTLPEEDLRTIDWKVEWCRRFEAARINPNYAIKVNRGKAALREFIRLERDHVDKWYFRKYGVRRQPGRPVAPEVNPCPGQLVEKERKSFDYPSPSTLNNWLSAYQAHGYRREAFKPRYDRCGNRNQLPQELELIVTDVIKHYQDLRRPEMTRVWERLEIELLKANGKRMGLPPLKVSDTTVYRRISPWSSVVSI